MLGDGGPFYLELIAAEVLELRHRGSGEATLAFADERIVLTPGDVLHLPLMGNWSAPSVHDPDHVLAGRVGSVPLVVGPGVVTSRDSAGVVSADMLRGQQLRALGLRLQMSNDQHVRLSDLANASPSDTTEAAAVKAD